jgi:hypothetical protein
MLSVTVTVNVHEPVLPLVSLAVQLTVVTPRGKVEPDAGVQLTVLDPSQLSFADSPVKVTGAAQVPGATFAERFEQPVKTGA